MTRSGYKWELTDEERIRLAGMVMNQERVDIEVYDDHMSSQVPIYEKHDAGMQDVFKVIMHLVLQDTKEEILIY